LLHSVGRGRGHTPLSTPTPNFIPRSINLSPATSQPVC